MIVLKLKCIDSFFIGPFRFTAGENFSFRITTLFEIGASNYAGQTVYIPISIEEFVGHFFIMDERDPDWLMLIGVT